MKITLIRHAKVNMKWEKYYNSAAFDNACALYETSDIIEDKNIIRRNTTEKIYISDLMRTYWTAVHLFGNNNFSKIELLNEVPIRSFKDTKKNLPCNIWMVLGRIQWWMGSKRQPEVKSETIVRAKRVVAMLIDAKEDCYIITHGFFLKILLKELKRAGFKISTNKMKFDNLDETIAININM